MRKIAKPAETSTRPAKRRRVATRVTATTNSPSGGPRSRTFTGCRTCRSRHLKCDEAKPVCSTCERFGLSCEGYEARLLWVPTDGLKLAPRGSSFRYPLFSEDARCSMSTALTRSICHRDADDILFDLDDECPVGLDSHTVGPFGVFRVFSVNSSPSSSSLSSLSSPPSSLDSVAATDHSDETVPSTCPPLPPFDPSTDPFRSFLDLIPDQWPTDDNGHPFQPLSLDVSPLFDPCPPPAGGTDLYSLSEDDVVLSEYPIEVPTDPPPALCRPSDLQLATSPSLVSASTSRLPAHAESLLRYYRDRILASSSWRSGERISPWQVCLLPCCLETFAELLLWNTSSHTRHSILCSLLSYSAFNLHSSRAATASDDRQWLGVALHHQTSAKMHLKKALQMELVAMDHAKYLEVLMAILGLAMVSVFQGSHSVQSFLLDAERLIRQCGLPSKKTFKMRVLHHKYTHLRVLSESFNVAIDASAHDESSCTRQRPRSRRRAGPKNAVPTTTELRTFRITEDHLAHDFDITQYKPTDISYNDIHLEVSGYFPATMFPDIYGIPESLVMLLARIIHLANERARQAVRGNPDSHVAAALLHHVKTLERSIWSWSEPAGPASSSSSLLDHPLSRHMGLALHQAVVLYFYRRIHNVSAMALQSFVQNVFDHLDPCFPVAAERQEFSATVAWSAFVACCEAATPALMDRSQRFLDILDSRGILFGVERPGEVARAVWEQREKRNDGCLSWPDVLGGTACVYG